MAPRLAQRALASCASQAQLAGALQPYGYALRLLMPTMGEQRWVHTVLVDSKLSQLRTAGV